MPDTPSEPEKYSLDEMMERLNKGSTDSPENGELVTRADGSQAIKVRKRKRRSEQPKKEKAIRAKRMRVIQTSVALVILLLLGLTAGGLFVYSNSAPFRRGLAEKISISTGASSEMAQFRVTPTGANASQLILKWPQGNMLDTLDLVRLTADINPSSYFGKTWTGAEAHAAHGTLYLRLPDKNEDLRALPPIQGSPKVNFNRFSANKLDVLFRDGDLTPISIQGAEASFYQSGSMKLPELRLNEGLVKIEGFSDFILNRSSIRFVDKTIDFNFLRLVNERDSRGILELTGKVHPYFPEERNRLEVSLDSYMIEELTGTMGTLIMGRVNTKPDKNSNIFTFAASSHPKSVLDISFASSVASALEMNHLPVLANISRAVDDQWFLRPLFETKAIGKLRREGKSVHLTDLYLEHRERMAVVGNIIADENEKLSGSLKIGVAPPVISAAPDERLDKIFGPVEDGFRWLEILISGTSGDPRDNFTEILSGEAPSPTASEDEGDSYGEKTSPITPEEMWEEATKPR